MQQYAIRILILVGLCWLGVAGTVFAANGNQDNQGNQGNQGNQEHRISAPEIDVGTAAGALTITAGVLALLAERLRRRRQ